MKELLKRYSLPIGIILMFLMTWPIDLANAGVLNFQVPFAVYIFLGWGFIFASLIMTGLTLGKGGVIALVKRYLIWRLDWKWYLAAFFLIPALNYLAILLNAMMTKMPKGYYVEWSGQWENQIRANKTLSLIMPIVVLIIFLILYFTYRSMKEALITMITVPFALIGGVFMVYFYGINLSVAVAVGFIALFGLAIETAMLITIYLNESMNKMVEKYGNSTETITEEILREYIIEGSAKRLRPKLMTVSVSLFGLIPILWATGTGADVMLPITVPLIGGTITSTIYVLLVTPVVFEMVKLRELRTKGKIEIIDAK